MNDRKSSLPDNSGQRQEGQAPVSVGRRRFAKGVAPVVLGTLVSKPVLGNDYFCTLSGQMSGNASAHDPRVVCPTGSSIATWMAAATWPGSYEKGAVATVVVSSSSVAGNVESTRQSGGNTKDACEFKTRDKGTPFNGTHGLAPTFYFSTATCEVGTTAIKNAEASMLQVLSTTDSSELFQLGRAVVASLLNAAKFPEYPVSQARIVDMFNAVKGGGTYHVEGANLNMSRLGVIQYLEKLFA